MQRRLLEATIDSLFDKGYGGTTTLEVQERAGVSRGALLHHFSSRAELILAAIDHLTRNRVDELVQLAQAEAPASGRIEWAVRLLWSTFQGPLFKVSLELWLAARNDPELLAALRPQERVLGQVIRGMAGEIFGPGLREREGFGDLVEVLGDAMRGAAARSILRSPRSDERLITVWVDYANCQLGKPDMAEAQQG